MIVVSFVCIAALIYAQIFQSNEDTYRYVNYMRLRIESLSAVLTNNGWDEDENFNNPEVWVSVTVGDETGKTGSKTGTRPSWDGPEFSGVNERVLSSVNISLYDQDPPTTLHDARDEFIGSVVVDLSDPIYRNRQTFLATIRDSNRVEQAALTLTVVVSCSYAECMCSTNDSCGGSSGNPCVMCAPTYRAKIDGLCSSLVACTDREHDPVKGDPEYPCGFDFGGKCYLEMDKTSCSTDCLKLSANFKPSEETDSRLCVLRDCKDRTSDPAAMFPCLDNACFLQPDGTCNKSCPENYQKNISTNICELKRCLDRRVVDDRCDKPTDDSVPEVGMCGWVQKSEEKWCSLCVDDSDYDPVTGECKNFADCALRRPNTDYALTTAASAAAWENSTENATEYVCGHSDWGRTCYLNFDRSSCSVDCDFGRSNYVVDSTNPYSLVCVLLPCSQRTHSRAPLPVPAPVGSRYYPCEKNREEDMPRCFLQPDNETCAESCPESYAEDASGSCHLAEKNSSKGGSKNTVIIVVVVAVVVVVVIIVVAVVVAWKLIKRNKEREQDRVQKITTVLFEADRKRREEQEGRSRDEGENVPSSGEEENLPGRGDTDETSI